MQAVDDAAVGELVVLRDVFDAGAAATELGDAADQDVAVAHGAADADEAIDQLLVARVGLQVLRGERVRAAEHFALLELGELEPEVGAGEQAAVGARLADDRAVLLVVAAVGRVGDPGVHAVRGHELVRERADERDFVVELEETVLVRAVREVQHVPAAGLAALVRLVGDAGRLGVVAEGRHVRREAEHRLLDVDVAEAGRNVVPVGRRPSLSSKHCRRTSMCHPAANPAD